MMHFGAGPIQRSVWKLYKFTGKERDTESALDMFGARYYASTMGRFITPDWAAKPTSVPYANFGNPQSLNLYSYVENNPTTTGDPDGHCDICWRIAMWAAAGIGEQGGKQFAKNVGVGVAKGAGTLNYRISFVAKCQTLRE